MINVLDTGSAKNIYAVSKSRSTAIQTGFDSTRITVGKESRLLITQLAQQQLDTLLEEESKRSSDNGSVSSDVQFLLNLIEDLNEEAAYEAAYEAVLDGMQSFYDYLLNSGGSFQITQAVQTNDGSILAEYEDFFVAEDAYGNRYFIDKHVSGQFWDD